MKIAVEFDGTMAEDNYPEIGELFPGVIDSLTDLKGSGHELILLTKRAYCDIDQNGKDTLTDVIDFFKAFDIEFDYINTLLNKCDFIITSKSINSPDFKVFWAEGNFNNFQTSVNGSLAINLINRKVFNYLNIDRDKALSKTQKKESVQARQIAMYFSREFTGRNLAYIGKEIGGKDHATVLHSCKTVNNLIETDKKYKEQIENIRDEIKMCNIQVFKKELQNPEISENKIINTYI